MSQPWVVKVDRVWKRYCRTMKRGVRYALSDSSRSFFNLGPSSRELREDEFWCIQDVSFSLGRGEGLALIGRNGAGKTTLLKLLNGVIAPDRGEIRVRGRVVSLMMVGAGFHPMLTGRENIYIYGSILGLRKKEIESRLDAIVAFAEIPEFLDTPVKDYSSGMYTRLAFSVAAQAQPQVFIVDEVLAVGDLGFREKCVQHLLKMKRAGTTLLMVSHSQRYLRRIADRGVWLEQGRCRAQGPIEDTLDAYLADLEVKTAAQQEPAVVLALPAPSDVLLTDGPEDGMPDDAAGPILVPAPPPSAAGAAVLVDREAQVELSSGAINQLDFHLPFREACQDLSVALALVTAAGDTIAENVLVLDASSYPQPAAGQELRFSFEVEPAVTAGSYELQLRLAYRRAGNGVAETVVAGRWPCAVHGRAAAAAGPDLGETVHAAARPGNTAEPATADSAWSDVDGTAVSVWATAVPQHSVDRGEEVRCELMVRGPVRELTWLIADEAGGEIMRLPLALPGSDHEWDITGSWRAALPPGGYREVLEVTDGAGRVGRFLGPLVRVTEDAEAIAHVDLAGRCVMSAIDTAPETGPDEPGPSHSAEQRPPDLALQDVTLTGHCAELNALVGRSPRLVTGFPGAVPTTPPLQAGEECEIVLRFRSLRPLVDWQVSVSFRRTGRGRCAGMRLRRARCGNGAGEFRVCFAFHANLSPGPYVIGCTLAGRDENGELVELHEAELASCVVIGPGSSGGDANLEFVHLEEEALPPPAATVLADGGPDLSFARMTLRGASEDRPAVVRTGESAVIEIDAVARRAIAHPAFKLRLVDQQLGRTVARLEGFDRDRPLASLAAGEARRYRLRVRPFLLGGCYRAEAALISRDGERSLVTDRCYDGPVFLVPRPGRPTGRALLATWITVEVRQAAAQTATDAVQVTVP